jgi:DNA end-binding protein Ku
MATRPSWRGHLSLSLVHCPVALYNAISPAGDVHFHLINPQTQHRVRTLTVDAQTEDVVERSELLKGYEFAKGKYVTLTQEEIDAVRLESTKTIDIEKFVPAESIDRLYWEHPYFLVPDGKIALQPFAVIRAAMEQAGQVAIGRVVMAQRERMVALEPRGKGIIATTLRSHDEVRDAKQFFDDIATPRTDKSMVEVARKIMQQLESGFDPKTFKDRYEDALRELIKRKRKGEDVVAAAEPKPESNVIDLMAALKASLDKRGDRAPAHRAQSQQRSSKTRRRVATRARTPARRRRATR